MTRFLSRIGVAALIIVLGVVGAAVAGETRGVALADLPESPVRAVTTAESGALYASLANESWPAGLYRSTDNGRTWDAVAPELNVPISALAVSPADPGRLYAGTGGGSLFKTSSLWSSEDGGLTWRRLVAPLPASPDGNLPAVTALVFNPTQPDLLYVGTDGHGVYRYDLAHNGYEMLNGVALREARVRDVMVGSAGQVYALTDRGLFVTEKDGWRELQELPEAAVTLAVAASAPQRLYLGTASSGAYRSDDGGRTWDWIGEGFDLAPGAALRVAALAVDPDDAGRVVAATTRQVAGKLAPGGVYESRDAGQHWTRLDGPDQVVTELVVKDGVAYAATENGLVRYGQAAASPLSLSGAGVPNGIQVLIVALAVGLAALVLLNWEKWLSERAGL